MRRLLAIVLSIALVVGVFPLEALARESLEHEAVYAYSENNTNEELPYTSTHIYYSDLFYGYPNYLASNSFLTSYNSDINHVYSTIYTNYLNSAAKYGTIMERTLEVITSSADLVKQISDVLGISDFDKNDAIDAANQRFVAQLLNDPAMDSLQDNLGKAEKMAKNIKTILKVFEPLEAEDSSRSAEEYIAEASSLLQESGTGLSLPENAATDILSQMEKSGISLSKIFGISATAIEIARAFAVALMMEDVRMETIDEIIASQTSDTLLKEGMIRLKDQLSNGFVSYFISNYVEKKLMDKVLESLGDIVYGTAEIKIATMLLKVAKMIVFDLLLDVPSYGDVLAYQVLVSYSNSLYTAITAKAKSFVNGPALSDEIMVYESLFSSYVAANNAALDIAASIAPYKGTYALFREAVENEIQNVTISSGNESITVSSHLTESEIQETLLQMLSSGHLVLTVDNGVRKTTLNNKATGCGYFLLESVNESQTVRAEFYDKYGKNDIYQLYVRSVMASISGEPTVQWSYVIDETVTLREQSDVIERNSVYTCDNKLFGSVEISGSVDLSFPVTIMGDMTWIAKEGSMAQIRNCSDVVVKGNATFSMAEPKYGEKTSAKFDLESGSSFSVQKYFTAKGSDREGEFELCLSGNVLVGWSIILSNRTTTDIYGNVTIGGNFNLIGEKIVVQSSITRLRIHDGANCSVAGDFKIRGASYGNVKVNWAIMDIQGGILTVGGDFNAENQLVSFSQTGANSVWTVCGDMYTYAENATWLSGFDWNADDGYPCNFTAGTLILKGDYTKKSGNTITPTGTHTIYLSGDGLQEISDINACRLVITNTHAVHFKTEIQISTLFDHRQNSFYFYEDPDFPDYDGDRIYDDYDANPVVPRCAKCSYSDELEILWNPYAYSYEWNPIITLGYSCVVCGEGRSKLSSLDLSVAGTTLTLQDNISINYMVRRGGVLEQENVDLYMVFELNGVETKVTDYTISENYYVFSFENIAPDQMNDTVRSTLYAAIEGYELSYEARDYSVATYCYEMLEDYGTDEYATLRTLLVDLLNYGAATQIYTGHNTDNLVNANLTEEQKAWASEDLEEFHDALDTKYESIDNPAVKWRGAGLTLDDAITMRFIIQTDSIEDLTVHIRDDNGHVWTVASNAFVKQEGNCYYIYFSGLDASQMSEYIYLTVYCGDTVVSNTVRYSIESYACAMKDSTQPNLSALLHSMMKYGNSAKIYKNQGV